MDTNSFKVYVSKYITGTLSTTPITFVVMKPAMINDRKKNNNSMMRKLNNTRNFANAILPLSMGNASILRIPLFCVSLLPIMMHTTTMEKGSRKYTKSNAL